MPPPGTLYMVATPLGNLEDMTFRAVRVLKEVDLIAAEDTRRTRKLLAHFGIATRIVGYRDQNHRKVLPRLLAVLNQGGGVALVTDAGTPGVSDPGAWLVREAAAAGALVTPIPGPSAVAAALSAAGLTADRFVFFGFLPARKRARRAALKELARESGTLVGFEAPHRIVEALDDALEFLGDRQAVLCREMTKLNEELVRGALSHIRGMMAERQPDIRGEMTLVIQGRSPSASTMLSVDELREIIRGDDRPVREIVADLAPLTGMNRSGLYRLVLETTGRRDRDG